MSSFLFLIACAAGPPELTPLPLQAADEAARRDESVEPDPDAVAPCTEPWTTNTRVSYADRTVAVHRFRPGADSERLVFALDEIRAVQASQAELGGGDRCAAIHLVMQDGRRLLFDDERIAVDGSGEPVGLEPRARRLADTIGVPLIVGDAEVEALAEIADDGAAASEPEPTR